MAASAGPAEPYRGASPHRGAIFAALALALVLAGCARTPPERAFYYWKTTPPDGRELALLNDLGATALYARAFDIDASGQAAGASLSMDAPTRSALAAMGVSVIPAVFVVNGGLAGGKGAALADKAIAALERGGWLPAGTRELQFDCDWTPATRDAYFDFLGRAAALLAGKGVELSATIRLHQAKDRGTNGIPPVARGALMAYNLLNPASAGGRSAILDVDTLRAYLPSLRGYPLPLDVALPAWSWTAQFEGSRFIGLIEGPRAIAEVRAGPFDAEGSGRYRAREACLVAGRTVEAGDLLVVDETGADKVVMAAGLIRAALGGRPGRVALFHLDAEGARAVAGGDARKLAAIYRAFE